VRQAALCPAGRWTQVMIGPLTELPLRFLRMGLSDLLGANFHCRVDDAPCPPFASHSASITLQ
jgi:hypothetical protein